MLESGAPDLTCLQHTEELSASEVAPRMQQQAYPIQAPCDNSWGTQTVQFSILQGLDR